MTAKVTLYTKDYCPHCKAAKALLKSKGIIFENYEVSTDPLLRAEMIARSGVILWHSMRLATLTRCWALGNLPDLKEEGQSNDPV